MRIGILVGMLAVVGLAIMPIAADDSDAEVEKDVIHNVSTSIPPQESVPEHYDYMINCVRIAVAATLAVMILVGRFWLKHS